MFTPFSPLQEHQKEEPEPKKEEESQRSNFLVSFDQQKKQEEEKSFPQLGTCLNLHSVDMQAELWESELSVVPMGQIGDASKKSGTSIGYLARRLEIFLDNLCSQSLSESSFLLSKRFAGIFSEADEQVRNAILGLIEKLPSNPQDASSFLKLKDFLDSLCEGDFGRFG